MCAYLAPTPYIIVTHNTTLNGSDNLHSYPPDKDPHSSDDVGLCRRRGVSG